MAAGRGARRGPALLRESPPVMVATARPTRVRASRYPVRRRHVAEPLQLRDLEDPTAKVPDSASGRRRVEDTDIAHEIRLKAARHPSRLHARLTRRWCWFSGSYPCCRRCFQCARRVGRHLCHLCHLCLLRRLGLLLLCRLGLCQRPWPLDSPNRIRHRCRRRGAAWRTWARRRQCQSPPSPRPGAAAAPRPLSLLTSTTSPKMPRHPPRRCWWGPSRRV